MQMKGLTCMIWNIILLVVICTVSYVWASYGLIMPIIILRTGFPLVRVLAAKSLINAPAARGLYTRSLVIWGIVDTVVIALMVIFANIWAWAGFVVGVGVVLLMGIGKTGANDQNKKDFLNGIARFVSADNAAAVYLTVRYYPMPVTDEMVKTFARQTQETE